MSNQMELNEKDFELLMEALDAWESQPHERGLSDMMKESILGRFNGRHLTEESVKASVDEAKRKGLGRRKTTILLRAKIELARQAAQAAAIASADGGAES